MNFKKQLKDGLITQNPVLVQLLGMCSLLAITTSLFNGIGMGLAVRPDPDLLQRRYLRRCGRSSPTRSVSPAYIVVIAGFVTMVDLLLQAFVPALSESLGLFIPLIVVNCIILGRAEAFCLQERHRRLRAGRHLPGHRLHHGPGDHERGP